MITGSGVLTIFFYKGFTRNLEIGNITVWVLPNIWRLGWFRNIKNGTNTSNKMLLNTTKYQGYSFYRFWAIKGKPTGGGGEVTHPPPRLGLKVLRHPDLKILAKKSNTLFFCMNRYLKCIMHKTMLWKTTKSQKNFLIYLPSKHIFTAWNVSIFGVNLARVLPHCGWVREIRSISQYSVRMRENTGQNSSE